MEKVFNVGDWVEVLDDAFFGKITRITSNEIFIETEDGFELGYQPHELILKSNTDELNRASSKGMIEEIKAQEIAADNKKRKSVFKNQKDPFVLKVDLHIEKLVRNPKQLSNFEILNIQMENARGQLEFAIENKMKQLVFIHGMGDGVLKAEIESLLGRYSGIYYQEADYATYGLGATEVYLNNPMPI